MQSDRIVMQKQIWLKSMAVKTSMLKRDEMLPRDSLVSSISNAHCDVIGRSLSHAPGWHISPHSLPTFIPNLETSACIPSYEGSSTSGADAQIMRL